MKIAMYDLEGYLLEVFDVETFAELERQLDVYKSAISRCVAGEIISTNNRQFRKFSQKCRIPNKIGDVSQMGLAFAKPIHKYYKGKYICSYDSSKLAAKKNGVFDTNINKCCQGIQQSAGGFEWKYAN